MPSLYRPGRLGIRKVTVVHRYRSVSLAGCPKCVRWKPALYGNRISNSPSCCGRAPCCPVPYADYWSCVLGEGVILSCWLPNPAWSSTDGRRLSVSVRDLATSKCTCSSRHWCWWCCSGWWTTRMILHVVMSLSCAAARSQMTDCYVPL